MCTGTGGHFALNVENLELKNYFRCETLLDLCMLLAPTYCGEDGGCEEDGLDVVPLVDGHLVRHVDPLVRRHSHSLLVILQLFQDNSAMKIVNS